MKLKEFRESVRRSRLYREGAAFADRAAKANPAATAAGLTFYLFLSLIPLLILLCSLLPYTGVTAQQLTAAVTRLTPEAINGLLTLLIEEAYASRVAIFSASCVFLLWAANKLTTALLRAMDEVYGQKEKRGYASLLLRSVLLTLALVLATGVLLLIEVRGMSAEKLFSAVFSAPAPPGKWTPTGIRLAAAAVCAPIFAVIYKFAPSGRRRFVKQLPGALFSAAAVVLFSLVFSVYSAGSNIYNSFYGSLTAVALLLFYVYICFQLFLYGGLLNAHLADREQSVEF